MKRKIFLFLFLSMFIVFGSSSLAYCSTVDDLITIGSEYNYWHIYNSGSFTYLHYYDEPLYINEIVDNNYRYNSNGAPLLCGSHQLFNSSISQNVPYGISQGKKISFGTDSTFVASNYDIKDSNGDVVFSATHSSSVATPTSEPTTEPTSEPTESPVDDSNIRYDFPPIQELVNANKEVYPHYLISYVKGNGKDVPDGYILYLVQKPEFATYQTDSKLCQIRGPLVKYGCVSNDEEWTHEGVISTICNVGHADSNADWRIIHTSDDFTYKDELVFQQAPTLKGAIIQMGNQGLTLVMRYLPLLLKSCLVLIVCLIGFRKAWSLLKAQLLT